MDIENVQEQEDIAPVVEAIEVPEAPISIRESLADALAKTKEPKEDVAKEVKVKADRPRTEDGKFVKEDKPEVKKASRESKLQIEAAPIAVEQPVKVPQSVPAALAQDFAKMPRSMQEFYAKRDEDYHKELTKHDEERQFGRSVRDLASPYLPLIRAEGGDVVKGFQSYLNTAYVLRTKSPQEKGQLLLQLAREYGADLQGASQAQPHVNPYLHQIQQEIAGLKGTIEQERALKKQQEDKALQTQIDEFAADEKNVHFETVRPHMGSLLRSGLAKNLQDAYEQAVYANPHTRSTLLQQQQQAVEEQRVADKKAKAEAARKAGSSIKGAPGIAATKNGKIIQPNLNSAIRAALAEHRGEA